MTDARTMTRDLQSEILRTVRTNQAAVVDAVEAWTSTVRSIAPQLPEITLPYADKLPRPHEVVATAYDFAEQLLTAQRQFADSLLQAADAQDSAPADGPATKAAHPAR